MKRFLVVVLCLAILFAILEYFSNANSECLESKYVFDIGSRIIKIHEVTIDKCKKEVVEREETEEIYLNKKDCFTYTEDKKTLNYACILQIYDKIKETQRQKDINCINQKCTAFTTSWSLKINNFDDIKKALSHLHIKTKRLSAKEEGRSSILAATAHRNAKHLNSKKLLLWDIGIQTIQFSTLHKDKAYVYSVPLGVLNYDKIIREKFNYQDFQEYQKQCFRKEDINQIIKYTIEHIGKPILKDKVIAKKIRDSGGEIVGVGLIFDKKIKKELKLPATITKDILQYYIYDFCYNDIDIIREMNPTLEEYFIYLIQQKFILIYSIMEALNINAIHIIDTQFIDYQLLKEHVTP